MQNIDKNKLFNAVIGSSGGRITKQNLESLLAGNSTDLLNTLDGADRKKLTELLADRKKLNALMQSEDFKNMLNRFGKGGAKNG